jgi:predicted ester cyclase
MSVKENKELLRRFFAPLDEKFNRETLKTENPRAVMAEKVRRDFEDFLTPDFTVHITGQTVHLEEYIQSNVMMCLGIPDVSFPIDHMIAEGDYVAVFFTVHGTHEGPMLGPQGVMPGTGNKFNYDGVYLCRFDKSKIAEVWACYDTLTMMQQLGAIPKK